MWYSCLQWWLVLSLTLSVCGILIGRLKEKEETVSNVVRGSAFMFPSSDEDRVECKTDHGYPGRCVDVRLCYAARRAVGSRNHPVRCGWINNVIPRVCCHPEQVQQMKMVFRPYRNRMRNRGERYA